MPAPGEKRWSLLRRRAGLMFWAVIAPEMIIVWAARQWMAARRIAKKYHGGQFSELLGLLCVSLIPKSLFNQCTGGRKRMRILFNWAGLMLFEGRESKGVLSEDRMDELLREGMIQFPTITEEAIRDRSKGDGLSKALVIAQTLWFVTQWIARRAQGLIITELELLTAALAVLNGIMYFLWWNKPLDVQCSVPVYLLDVPLSEEKRFNFNLQPEDRDRLWGRISNTFKLSVHPGFLKTTSSTYLHKIRGMLTPTKAGILDALKTIGQHLSPRNVFLSMVAGNDSISPSSPRVPTFYGATIRDEETQLVVFGCFTAIMIFCAIHCAAWARNGFSFPSHAEFLLWFIFSVTITAFPSVFFIGFSFTIIGESVSGAWRVLIDLIRLVAVLASLNVLHIIARIVLLVEAVVSLRDLPAGALEVVTWVTFWPHVS